MRGSCRVATLLRSSSEKVRSGLELAAGVLNDDVQYKFTIKGLFLDIFDIILLYPEFHACPTCVFWSPFFFCFPTELDQPPVARVMQSASISLPLRTAILDGSHSTDDKGGLTYQWTRDDSSPAAGVRPKSSNTDKNKERSCLRSV